ncbi:unnamed protein product [Clonostachys rosea]|uniref:Uncharacterized protein n=1 Tax=Bionectria ochroleuca TaxID=29856 RepID=A0ABY6U7S5_BIOOC|nr:unnamed protein product [Clonostachys rosea]
MSRSSLLFALLALQVSVSWAAPKRHHHFHGGKDQTDVDDTNSGNANPTGSDDLFPGFPGDVEDLIPSEWKSLFPTDFFGGGDSTPGPVPITDSAPSHTADAPSYTRSPNSTGRTRTSTAKHTQVTTPSRSTRTSSPSRSTGIISRSTDAPSPSTDVPSRSVTSPSRSSTTAGNGGGGGNGSYGPTFITIVPTNSA